MLVLDEFEIHLTMDVRSVIQGVNTDHVWLLHGGMTLQLYVLVNNSFKDHLNELYSE
jgi:hypothetical protein